MLFPVLPFIETGQPSVQDNLSGNIPSLIDITPLSLIFGTLGNPQEGIVSSLAMQAVMGEPITRFMPIITTVLWSILFFVVAVWRFRREEF